MDKTKMAIFALAAIAIPWAGAAFAQTTPSPEIAFDAAQLIIIGIGVVAGFVTAYNGLSKAKANNPDEKFDLTKFLDRVLIAALGSIPLAIAEAANVVKLDLFGAWIVFAAALGTTQFVMEIRSRNTKK